MTNGTDTSEQCGFTVGDNAGTDKSDTDLKQEATYSSGLGWQFDGDNNTHPWNIKENESYPYLYWQDL